MCGYVCVRATLSVNGILINTYEKYVLIFNHSKYVCERGQRMREGRTETDKTWDLQNLCLMYLTASRIDDT